MHRRKAASSGPVSYTHLDVYKRQGENTLCPKCGKTVLEREGFTIKNDHIRHGRCEYCHQPIAGVWGA